MKIGSGWRSGLDLTALDNLKKESLEIDLDKDFRYKFNNTGFLSLQNVKGQAQNENISTVRITADHGFVYVASKEFFFYSDKTSILLDPIDQTEIVPEYIRVALGYDSGIPDQVYSKYSFSGIPTFLTPMVVSRLTTKDYETPLVVKNTLNLEDVDRNTVTKLANKLTGIEEPIVEIFEVDSMRDLNGTQNEIINPTKYIYNPFDGLIYIKGEEERILVEFESTTNKRVNLGKKFSPSRTGKDRGILALSANVAKTRGSNVSTVSRRLLDIQGSTIYINQDPGDSVRVVPETRYQLENGDYLEYETLENNSEYAVIQTPNPNVEIFLSSVRVGKTNNAGTAIVPILAYLETVMHMPFLRTGSTVISVYPAPSGIVAGKLRVKIYAIESETLIATEDFLINKQKQRVSVASSERVSQYIPKLTTSAIISQAINIDDITLFKLRETYDPLIAGLPVVDARLSGDSSVELMFEAQPEGSLIFYDSLPFRVIDKLGGGNYGI